MGAEERLSRASHLLGSRSGTDRAPGVEELGDDVHLGDRAAGSWSWRVGAPSGQGYQQRGDSDARAAKLTLHDPGLTTAGAESPSAKDGARPEAQWLQAGAVKQAPGRSYAALAGTGAFASAGLTSIRIP